MSSYIKVKSSFNVDLHDVMGSDQQICRAARVSTLGVSSMDTEESQGLLNFLMKNRHGSPFEHGAMTFRIYAPIFVWREFMRHRIGFSYNEQSGRYMELDGMFYIPPIDRPLIQQGKPGEYRFVEGAPQDVHATQDTFLESYDVAWKAYQTLLERGIAKEVARMCLPVSIYSAAYVTCNPRSLMHFLSLRTKHPESMFPSFPQWEINEVANMMEEHFSVRWPLTHSAFENNGRVAP